MTVRRWKLTGQQLDPVVTATIDINGTRVFSGNFIEIVDATLNETFIASGTYEVDDSVDTLYNLSLTVSEGSVLVGIMYWDWQYQISNSLTAEEKAYLFTGQFQPGVVQPVIEGVVPQAVLDSVATKGGFGSYNQDFFNYNPGRAAGLDPVSRTRDARKGIKLDGADVSVDLHLPIMVMAGSTLTFTSGIAAKPQV